MNTDEILLKTILEAADRAIYAVIKKESFTASDGNVQQAVKRNDIVSLINYMLKFEKDIQSRSFYEERRAKKAEILKFLKEESPKIIEMQNYTANSGQNKQYVSYISADQIIRAIKLLENTAQTSNVKIIWG